MLKYMINHPRILVIVCLALMWFMARLGLWIRRSLRVPPQEDKDNLTVVLSATLTLLGLIIGFTFSMAATRYDQRRLFEEEEANAIGTEYLRADLLPGPAAVSVKAKLLEYLDLRVAFYQTDYGQILQGVDNKTAALQSQLWTLMPPQAAAQPTPLTALVVSGMNDVLNRQGYTQYAWWNRIPTSAWGLMITIALFANLLMGYATKPSRSGNLLLLVLPLLISVSFFLVSDIDSPRGGIIRVVPVDLISLSRQLHGSPR